MKTITYSCFFAAGFLMAVQGCSPVMYSATGANTPMFTQKKEFNVTVSSAASVSEEGFTDASGFAGQAAYAVSDKWAAIGSYYFMNNDIDPEVGDWVSKGSYFELGGGRYGTLKNNNHIAWEAFGGLGLGNINNQQADNQMDAGHFKIFLQPSAGIITRYFDFIVTPRVSLVTYTGKTYHFADPSMKSQADQFFSDQGTKLLFEPCFTLRAGYENFKLQVQYSLTSFKATYNNITPINDRYISLGLCFLFSNRYSKK